MVTQSLNISIPSMPILSPLVVFQFNKHTAVHGYKDWQLLPQLDDKKRVGVISGRNFYHLDPPVKSYVIMPLSKKKILKAEVKMFNISIKAQLIRVISSSESAETVADL